MKLNELLKESTSFFTPKQMTDDEIIEWCKKNAMGFLKNKAPIFRGLSVGSSGLYNTDNFNRVAKSIPNTCNLWLSNHPDWAKFPKRTKSLIGANHAHVARSYGNAVHYLIPADNANIGICPTSDMWESFDLPESLDLPDFLVAMEHVGVLSSSWDELIRSSKLIDRNSLTNDNLDEDEPDDYDMIQHHNNVLDFFNEHQVDNAYELFEKVFITKDFSHIQADKKLIKSDSREVWVGGNVLQLHNARVLNNDKLSEFFNYKSLT